MDIAGSFKRAIEILKLNGAVAVEVARDERALAPGLVFVAVSGAAGALGGGGGVGAALFTGPIAAVLMSFVGVGILHLSATVLFGARGDYMALYRVQAHAAVLNWAAVVPFVGPLVGLWGIPVSVVILEHVYGMPRPKAMGAVAVVVGLFLLLGVAAFVMLGALMGGLLGT